MVKAMESACPPTWSQTTLFVPLPTSAPSAEPLNRLLSLVHTHGTEHLLCTRHSFRYKRELDEPGRESLCPHGSQQKGQMLAK